MVVRSSTPFPLPKNEGQTTRLYTVRRKPKFGEVHSDDINRSKLVYHFSVISPLCSMHRNGSTCILYKRLHVSHALNSVWLSKNDQKGGTSQVAASLNTSLTFFHSSRTQARTKPSSIEAFNFMNQSSIVYHSIRARLSSAESQLHTFGVVDSNFTGAKKK